MAEVYYPQHLWTPDICREQLREMYGQHRSDFATALAKGMEPGDFYSRASRNSKMIAAMLGYCRNRWPEEDWDGFELEQIDEQFTVLGANATGVPEPLTLAMSYPSEYVERLREASGA